MYKQIKKVLDSLLAIILLIIAFIPMIIISIAIKLEDQGPVLFKQKRTGLNGKTFNLYKFRSMTVDNDVTNFKEKDHITKIGNIIRKTSLDELPQLINILKGEMSFIGPRPWITEYFENMNENQKQRVKVLPGITGLAQVKGRNGLDVMEKINYDIEYINNYSLKQDLKIVFLTIKTVITGTHYQIGKAGIKEDLEMLKNQ